MIRHWRLFRLILALIFFATAPPSSASERHVSNCGGRVVDFGFEDTTEARAQEFFIAAFCREVGKAQEWFIQNGWRSSAEFAPGRRIFELPNADMQISISNQSPFSKSLSFSFKGQQGKMEFPTAEIDPNSFKAAIMHELAHTYFPNRNRFVDEGFAVYLQNKVGGNAAFPDDKKDLHELMRKLACDLDSSLNSNPHPTPLGGLAKIKVVVMDRTATLGPQDLNLHLQNTTGPAEPSKPSMEAFIVAGSFVRFLIDKHGLDAFHKLYMVTTPLNQGNPEGAGPENRWMGPFPEPLSELEEKWKSLIASQACPVPGAHN